jgi:hypothetical protein
VVLTPEFLLWAIEYSCPLRGEQDGRDPEKIERQLRAARAASDARQQGRIFAGLAVKPPDAFRLRETLALYGGESGLQACAQCPANLDGREQWAGCYGRVVLPHGDADFHAAVNAAFDCQEATAAGMLPQTTPRWYGLWIDGPLTGARASAIAAVLRAAQQWDAQAKSEVGRLIAALDRVVRQRLTLHAAMYPQGDGCGSIWKVAAHCPRCKVTWRTGNPRQGCQVCGYEGRPAPSKSRHSRGQRPYRALDQLLGADQAAAFLARYADFRAQQAPPDQEPGPPPPGPPGNPPDDSDS